VQVTLLKLGVDVYLYHVAGVVVASK
jgi:hypothetical protein